MFGRILKIPLFNFERVQLFNLFSVSTNNFEFAGKVLLTHFIRIIPFYIETSIWFARQINKTGLYMKCKARLKWVNL